MATISTYPLWDGSSFINPWGIPNTKYYGQTFQAEGSFLQGITVSTQLESGSGAQYYGYIYLWDTASNNLSGNALWAGSLQSMHANSSFQDVAIDVSLQGLEEGREYAFFLEAVGSSSTRYRWGGWYSGTDNYPQGEFIFSNTTTNSWGFLTNADLAFSAIFPSDPAPDPDPDQGCTGIWWQGDDLPNLRFGTECNDSLYGLGEGDRLIGFDGNDQLYGGLGADIISAGLGNDYIDGAEGADVMFGGAGNDVIIGGAGRNIFKGGIGENVLYAGGGRDAFMLGEGSDFITDFDTAKDQLFIAEGTTYTLSVTSNNFLNVALSSGGSATLYGNWSNADLSAFETNNITNVDPLPFLA